MGAVSSEPSMEDILASIKKIIAEDSTKKLSPSAPRHDVPSEQAADTLEDSAEDHEILDLSETAVDPEPSEPVIKPAKVTSFAMPPVAVDTNIVSDETSTASRSSLQALSALIVKPDVAGSDTLEGLVREMLRPMLKDWLDANLPEIVEAVVAKEVARISGRVL